MIYLLIFLLKIIENMLSTFRIILVSNGQKIVASILIFLISLIWIISSSITIININLLSICIFSFGSFIGSFLGSLLEENLAVGMSLIIVISSNDVAPVLRSNGYIITDLTGSGIRGNKNILLIIIKKRKYRNLIKYIKSIDKKAIILTENTNVQ